jgi:hypothetical protein
MSKASTTRTIKFIAKAGTYTALIMCPDGDIYQEWEGTESDVTKVLPIWLRFSSFSIPSRNPTLLRCSLTLNRQSRNLTLFV